VIIAAVVAFQVATYTLPPVELPPYVSEEPEVVWYPISGSTLADLRRQMTLHGPRDAEGVHAGLTRDWTRWHVQFGGGGNAGPCRIRTVSVTTYDTVTLPLWTPPPHADLALVAEWGRFVTMLGRHEAGHRSIAIDGAGKIAQTLAALPSRATCPDLLKAANMQSEYVLASTQDRQKQYDADTQHGLLRGTALEDLDAPAQFRLSTILTVAAIVALVLAIGWLVQSRAR
jgi:predicted secreted Zn-dependent protease